MAIQLSGSLAITGSLTTTTTIGAQGAINVTNATNPVSFTSTASLYSDGGVRFTKDMYVSGTAYFNNVTVFGTQSIAYISSSQLNIGTNLITVNTDTPTVRFGGLAVYDSGSTGLTGSILWDSENNHWVYTNPSGSTYSGGMLISGPRNTNALGSEVGTTACALMMGQGGDHITSSAVFHYGNATCFYGNATIQSTGATCLASTLSATKGTFIGTGYVLDLNRTDNTALVQLQYNGTVGSLLGTTGANNLTVYNASAAPMLNLTSGIGCFSGAVCAPAFVGGTVNGTTGTFSSNAASLTFGTNDTVEKYMTIRFSNGDFFVGGTSVQNYIYGAGSRNLALWTNSTQRFLIDGNGVSCFACQVCAPMILASGCVGINITDPLTRLHVQFAGTTTTTCMACLKDGALVLYNANAGSSTNGTVGIFGQNAGALGLSSGIGFSRESSGDWGTQLRFYTHPTTTTEIDVVCERMRITGDGNVGVGTTSPAEKLEISGTSNIYAKVTSTSTGANAGIRFNSTGAREYGIFTDGDLRFYDFTASSERMRITSGGNVGIGTTSFLNSSNVQVSTNSGNTNAVIFSVYNTAACPSTTAQAQIGLGFINGTTSYTPDGICLGEITYFGQGNNAGYGGASIKAILVSGGGNTSRTCPSVDLVLYTKPKGDTGINERMRITGDGIACFSSAVCVGGVLVVNGNTINVNCDTTTATDARINLYTRNSVNGDRASIYTYNLSATTGGCELTYLAFGYCCTNNQGYINMQTKSGGAWCNTFTMVNGLVGLGTVDPIDRLNICGVDSGLYISNSTRSRLNLHTCGCGSWQIETTNISGNQPGGALGITEAGVGSKFHIAKGGVACFQNAVCMPVLLASGCILINQTSAIQGVSTFVEMSGVGTVTPTSQASYNVHSWHGNNPTWRGYLQFFKSRGTTIGSYTAVSNGDDLGTVRWTGADGSGAVIGAEINAYVDGVPGVNDMPTRLAFLTTADGASSPTERMRITNGGCVIVNGTSASSIMTIYPAAGSSDTLTYRTTGNTAAGALYAYSDGNGPSSGILHNVSITSGGGANRFNGSFSGWTVAFDSRPASDAMTFNYVDTSGTYITRISLAGNGITCFGCAISIGAASTSAEANLFLGARGTNEGGQLVLQKATSCSCATHLDNYEDKFRVLVGTDTATNGVHFQIDHKTRDANFYGQVQTICGFNSAFYNGSGARYNFTSLNTAQALVGICANNGILVIRDHTAGGTGAFLIDPNQGVICMASNIPATVSIAYHPSGGLWCWCLTTGGVPRCLGYGFYGA